MSKGPPHGASKIEPSNGGGAGKWLLGGLAAVVLASGAYAAWTTMSPQQDRSQFAYTDEYADEYGADPLRESDEDTAAESASTDDAPAPATRSTPAPRATASADDAVPEATFGITPISATTDDADTQDIIVTAPRRPVWARTPSARRLSAMYPVRALQDGREGEARLQCMVEDGGALDCQRVEETPGFGPAAMRVARSLRHAPALADGRDAAGTPVNLRVVFRIDDNRRS